MRILLIGANGQVGQELQRSLASLGEVTTLERSQVDLAQPENLRFLVQAHAPEVIVNAAAYTAVDKAEAEWDLALAVNATTPQILAEVAQQLGATLIHFSTDYVFDGNHSQPYLETDATNPLGAYGRSKLQGEIAIQQHCPQHLIVRTAWVYGSYGKSNFVKTMLRLGAERDVLRVVADQVGTPTWAADLADAIAQLMPQLGPELWGTYHYTNSGAISWYDFAVAIFEEAAALGFPLRVQEVVPITTAEYPTAAQRPAYSVLSRSKISARLGTYPPYWRRSLRQMLQQLKQLT